MKEDLLKKSVESLSELRTEMRDKVDVSTIQKLDDVITYLESLKKRGKMNLREAQKVLVMLGCVMRRLPDIENIIRSFFE